MSPAPLKCETGELDVNGDGKPDLVASNYSASSVSVLLNGSFGSFLPAQNVATGSGPYAVIAVDLNGDGLPDLVTADGSLNEVGVLLGQHR